MTEINPITRKSLRLRMYFNETPLAYGTAFVVHTNRGPHIVTNRHNLTGRNQITGEPLSRTAAIPNRVEISFKSREDDVSWISLSENLQIDNGDNRWIEHPHLAHVADVVALPFADHTGLRLDSYHLGGHDVEIRVGPADPVSVIGFPFGLDSGAGHAVWATGFVASELDARYNDLPVFLVDCRTREGQSGSPVVAYRSSGMVPMSDGSQAVGAPMTRFLGIYSGRVNKESDLGMVWRPSVIQEIIQSI